jgi:hypothetical protein
LFNWVNLIKTHTQRDLGKMGRADDQLNTFISFIALQLENMSLQAVVSGKDFICPSDLDSMVHQERKWPHQLCSGLSGRHFGVLHLSQKALSAL